VVIAAPTISSHHGICGSSHKTNPLTAKAKTNKNRNEQILRNAEDAVRTEETEDSHKCQRKEGLAKMKIAYKFGILTIVQAENYYPTCKGRGIQIVGLQLKIKLLVTQKYVYIYIYIYIYISPFTGKFKIMKQPLQGGKLFKDMKTKIKNIPTHVFSSSVYDFRNGLKIRSRWPCGLRLSTGGRFIAGIAVSTPTQGTDLRSLCLFCVV